MGGKGGFVKARFLEADREGLERAILDISRSQGRNRRGVETTTQENAERDIRHKAPAGRSGESFQQFLRERGFGFMVILWLQRIAPVALDFW